jgi:anthranilate phosphoribosyltransferase
MFDQLLSKRKSQSSLSRQEFGYLQEEILQNKVGLAQFLELFEELERNPIQLEEFLGAVKTSQKYTQKVQTNHPTLDIVGTGGDGLHTFNISTLAALVVASCGVKVAKHGNRAASGLAGTADTLENLGVKIDLDATKTGYILDQIGFCFCFAKSFNPAFRFVAEARKTWGKPTYFNFLGPTLNPTSPSFMVLGVNNYTMTDFLGKAILENDPQTNQIKSKNRRVWVLKSDDGLDEIGPESNTCVTDFRILDQKITTQELLINPNDFVSQKSYLSQIQVQTATEASTVFRQVLQNQATPTQIETVCLNAAAGLLVSGKVENLKTGFELAKEALANGKTLALFTKFVDLSNQL